MNGEKEKLNEVGKGVNIRMFSMMKGYHNMAQNYICKENVLLLKQGKSRSSSKISLKINCSQEFWIIGEEFSPSWSLTALSTCVNLDSNVLSKLTLPARKIILRLSSIFPQQYILLTKSKKNLSTSFQLNLQQLSSFPANGAYPLFDIMMPRCLMLPRH